MQTHPIPPKKKTHQKTQPTNKQKQTTKKESKQEKSVQPKRVRVPEQVLLSLLSFQRWGQRHLATSLPLSWARRHRWEQPPLLLESQGFRATGDSHHTHTDWFAATSLRLEHRGTPAELLLFRDHFFFNPLPSHVHINTPLSPRTISLWRPLLLDFSWGRF